MSFIPGSGKQIIGANIGSGINVNSINDIDFLSVNLEAGPNVDLIPSQVNNSIKIAVSGESGGIASVVSVPGSGINTSIIGSTISLSSALVGNTGIDLVAGTGKNLLINNSHTYSSGNGTGITITQSNDNFQFQTALTAGTGLSITPSASNTSIQLANTGLLGANASTGITTSISNGILSIANAGLLGANALPNSGISTTTTNGILELSNTGILGLFSGQGIALATCNTSIPEVSAQRPEIVNTGILSVSGGSGIFVSPGQNPTITAQLIAIQAGTGIDIDPSDGTGIPTIANTGVLSNIAGSGIEIGGTTQNPIISNTGVLSILNGPGISTNVTSGNVTISAIPQALVSGLGIALTNDNQGNRVITNTGVRSISVSNGITIDNTVPTAPVLSNSGVLALTAGSNISIGGTSNNPIITNTGVRSVEVGLGLGNISTDPFNPQLINTGVQLIGFGPNAGIENTGSTQLPVLRNTGLLSANASTGITATTSDGVLTIANSGVLGISAGTNVSITGTAQNPVINATPPSLPSTNVIVGFLGTPLEADTTSPNVAVAFPGSAQACDSNQVWILSGRFFGTFSDNLFLAYKFNVAGAIGNILTLPPSFSGLAQSFTIVIEIPTGNTSFQLEVFSPQNASAFLSMLSYTRIK